MALRAPVLDAALSDWPVRRWMKMWDGEVSMLAWERAHERAPGVHFAHANGFNSLTYRALLDPLSSQLRLYASDLRGHGHSTLAANPKGMNSWHIYRDDILRTLEGLDGRPKILAGHSMGATASLMAALAKPNWVSGLVLIEPVIFPRRAMPLLQLFKNTGLLKRVMPVARTAQRRRSVWPSRDAMFAAYRGRGAFRTWPEDIVRDYVTGGAVDYIDDKQVRLACTPGWEAANYAAGPPDLWRDVAQLNCPTTLIVGTRRSTCPERSIEQLLERRPGIRVVRVDGASHFLPMEFPTIVRDEIDLLAKGLHR